MTYQDMTNLTGSWGLAFFIFIFAIVVVYALWPGNKEKFTEAAGRALDDE